MPINKIVLYVKDVERTVAFYEKYFGVRAERETGDRIVELVNPDGGAALMIHKAGKAQQAGQSQMKLTFDIEDVRDPGGNRSRFQAASFASLAHECWSF